MKKQSFDEIPQGQPAAEAEYSTGKVNGVPPPPAGTYPGPNAEPVAPQLPQAPPPASQPQPKGRRVGTITMALSLITFGVIMVLRVFLPQLDYIFIARLAPGVLIFLGIEILVANIRHSGEKLRYDVLSVIICLLLIAGSLAAATIPEIVERQYTADRVSERLSAELEVDTNARLAKEGYTGAYVEWYISVRNNDFVEDMTYEQLRPEHYIQARVFIPGSYDDKEDFAKACYGVAELLQEYVPHVDYSSFYSYNEYDSADRKSTMVRYAMWLQSRWQYQSDEDQWPQWVDAEYWLEDEGYYVVEWEYFDRIENPGNYGYSEEDYGEEGDEDYGDEDDSDVSSVPDDGNASSIITDSDDTSVSVPASSAA